jgi:hypothetical protein
MRDFYRDQFENAQSRLRETHPQAAPPPFSDSGTASHRRRAALEPRLDVGQPDVIGPAVGAGLYMVAAAVVAPLIGAGGRAPLAGKPDMLANYQTAQRPGGLGAGFRAFETPLAEVGQGSILHPGETPVSPKHLQSIRESELSQHVEQFAASSRGGGAGKPNAADALVVMRGS